MRTLLLNSWGELCASAGDWGGRGRPAGAGGAPTVAAVRTLVVSCRCTASSGSSLADTALILGNMFLMPSPSRAVRLGLACRPRSPGPGSRSISGSGIRPPRGPGRQEVTSEIPFEGWATLSPRRSPRREHHKSQAVTRQP